MNILITTRCNKNCSFCFINDERDSRKDISLSDFKFCLDFASKSNIDSLYLLGGEPTIHHMFDQLIEMTANNGFKITLLSNFIFTEKISSVINSSLNENIFSEFLINADFPDEYNNESYSIFLNNIKYLDYCPTKITLAVTVRDIKPLSAYQYLIDYYKNFDISRVRISLDVATLWYYLGNKEMGNHYYSVVRYLSEHGFIVNTELCAMSKCMFSEYEDNYLRAHCIGYDNLMTCKPNLYIFPDLTVRYCASRPAESIFSHSLKDFINIAHARNYFESMNQLLSLQPKEICKNCSFHNSKECRLNCLSRFDSYKRPQNNEKPIIDIIPDTFIIPLIDRWHIYKLINKTAISFILDDISLEILKYFWSGYTENEIAQDISKSYFISYEKALFDVKELKLQLVELAEKRYDTEK